MSHINYYIIKAGYNKGFDAWKKIKTGLRGEKRVTEIEPNKENVSRRMDLIVCQDYQNFHMYMNGIRKLLKEKGCDIHVECVMDKTALWKSLEKRHDQGLPPPTDILMDVSGGHGAPVALDVARWIENKYPQFDRPRINFLSCDLSMAITAAGKLRSLDVRSMASAVDENELTWTKVYLQSGSTIEADRLFMPYTATLRNLLNEGFGLEIPLTMSDSYKTELDHLDKTFSNDSIISAWQQGKVPAEEVIRRMRSYATGVAESLRNGLYAVGAEETAGLEPDVVFYGGAGFARKGEVVFALEEVRLAASGGEKPVLVMGSYDPSVVPLLAEGALGGLVVLSSFMASHLKLLCETHMVTGLFGLMPEKRRLSDSFEEAAQPDAPPFLEGDSVLIGGKKVARGQQVLLGIGGNGLMLEPPPSFKGRDMDAIDLRDNPKLKADFDNLNKMKQVFAEYFNKNDIPLHMVKANIDSGSRSQLAIVDGVGLMRTEQMIATDRSMLGRLKEGLFQPGGNFDALMNGHRYDYKSVIEKLHYFQPVKIRLFDFVHSEILDKAEQERFLSLYPKLDIHGGDALRTWPQLYRRQAEAIFTALAAENVESGVPLEVMMPAVRTEGDVMMIRDIIRREARNSEINTEDYRFGVMVETLEACENIEKIAPLCDFISFGTNDLTQQHTGMARGDFKAHANFANKNGYDPFRALSPEITEMILDVTKRARAVNPGIGVDICGAQAADMAVAMKLFAGGVNNISVAANIANLYGLPTLLNYQIYDSRQKTVAHRHQPKQSFN